MDNENKKVNNAENISGENSAALNEILDGFYDLSRLYSTPAKEKTPPKPKNREEELKQRDEQRRALEMQAIKEDIERRYSLQLETAQNNAAPPAAKKKRPVAQTNLMPEIDERETVKEELERIDKIINGDDNSQKADEDKPAKKKPKKYKKKKTKAKKEPVADFDINETNFIYATFYNFGNTIYKVLAAVFSAVFGLIKKPFVYLFGSLSRATESTKRKAVKTAQSTLKEADHFRKEIKRAGKSIKRALKKPHTLPSVIIHYIKQAIARHSGLLKSAANTLLPIGAFLLFLITYNYWNSVTFALEVIYNDQSIGYISNESVYLEAKDLVKDRLSSSAYSSAESSITEETAASASNLSAKYNLSLVSVDQLTDAQAISDKMIENSVDNLTHACGVYIDGEFICAVKNEADAKTVFYDILTPYEADAEKNGYVVGFAENIDYVQGLYRDDKSVMWDATELSAVLTGSTKPKKTYTVTKEDETIKTVVENTGVSEETLKSLNLTVDWDNLQPGDEIVTEGGEKLISIRKIVTSTTVRDIEFETVKRRDATKYSGYRQVLQKGINGSERVTKTQIYIDGVPLEPEYSYETITEPVDEIVAIGTKTTYGGVYIGMASDSGFLWPAPSCHRVSSPYGWRSSGWHNGIDLVKAGGGASGTPVIASKSGTVEVVQRSNSGYGNMVLINHGNGYKTRYAHMIKGSITVSVGDYVEAGQTIGKVGSTGNSTGPHLHFEVIYRGETQNPKNYIY